MVQKGSTVKFHYTLKVDGSKVDSSVGRDPMVYVHGSGQIVPGLEEQLEGMGAGEKKEVSVSPGKGYGERDSRAIQKIPRRSVPNLKDPKVGNMVGGQVEGRPVRAIITAIGDEELTLDFNHPLAGKTLSFAVEIVSVKSPESAN